MNKNDIYKLRQELAKEEERIDRAKTKRCIITILIIAAVFFIAAIKMNQIKLTVLEIIGCSLGCVFLAGIYFWINSLIFIALHEKGKSETRYLENMRKEIDEFERRKARDEYRQKRIATRDEYRQKRIAALEAKYPGVKTEIDKLIEEEKELEKILDED